MVKRRIAALLMSDFDASAGIIRLKLSFNKKPFVNQAVGWLTGMAGCLPALSHETRYEMSRNNVQ